MTASSPAPLEGELDQKLLVILADYSNDLAALKKRDGKLPAQAAVSRLQTLLTNQAKAYGGCVLCYGKGYATVSDRWIGQDTDQDIGSPGGTVQGGSDFAMKFCTCERGKQLEGLVGGLLTSARIDELKRLPNFKNGAHQHKYKSGRISQLKRESLEAEL